MVENKAIAGVQEVPDESQRKYHIGFARALLETLDDDLTQALRESWDPGASVTRYNRRWHLTRVIDETSQLLHGRIGFVSDGELSTLVFDQRSRDFLMGEAPSGVVIPFVVRKSDGLIAFQLYPGVVRETTFTGALQDLLNSKSEMHVWNVATLTETREFDEWYRDTHGIKKFDFTLERPNPHYLGRPIVESIIEETRLESVRIAGKVLEGESIDIQSGIFRQSLDHVLKNYGKAKLVAEDIDGSDTTWLKRRNAGGRVASKRTRLAYGPEQAPESVLTAVLEEAPVGASTESLDEDE